MVCVHARGQQQCFNVSLASLRRRVPGMHQLNAATRQGSIVLSFELFELVKEEWQPGPEGGARSSHPEGGARSSHPERGERRRLWPGDEGQQGELTRQARLCQELEEAAQSWSTATLQDLPHGTVLTLQVCCFVGCCVGLDFG